MQDFCLLVMDSIGAERDRRLHGGEREQLKEMIGHHVAQRSCHVKISAAFFHSYGFSHGDLNMINKAMVPDRLKDAVAEAKNQNVLYRFLAQVMINAENLVLSQHFLDLVVKLLGRFQIVSKRFSENQPAPALVF